MAEQVGAEHVSGAVVERGCGWCERCQQVCLRKYLRAASGSVITCTLCRGGAQRSLSVETEVRARVAPGPAAGGLDNPSVVEPTAAV